jgi:hypothetical protein
MGLVPRGADLGWRLALAILELEPRPQARGKKVRHSLVGERSQVPVKKLRQRQVEWRSLPKAEMAPALSVEELPQPPVVELASQQMRTAAEERSAATRVRQQDRLERGPVAAWHR